MLEQLMNAVNLNNEDRATRWESHRRNICNLIDRIAEPSEQDDQPQNVIIFGAGRCDDLDFSFLDKRFNQIVLADIDSRTVEGAVERLPQEKILIKAFDFSGLEQVNYYQNIKALIRDGNVKKLVRYIRKAALDLKVQQWPEDKYTVVLSTAVYSQLCYIPSLLILAPYVETFSKKQVEEIKEEIVYLTQIVIANYNRLLTSVCKNRGGIVSVSDVIDLSIIPFHYRHPADLKPVMPQLFASGYGVVGGKYGIDDLKERLTPASIQLQDWVWDFSIQRKFYTFALAGKTENT
jgi:cellobiose-specific phosphotransferase system component IIB